MKKIVFTLLLVFLFISCKEEFPYTNDTKKKEIIKSMLNLDNESESDNAFEEQKKILNELNKLVYQGDKKAIKEIEKWNEIFEKESENFNTLLDKTIEKENYLKQNSSNKFQSLELKNYNNEKDCFSIDYPIRIFSVSERTEEEMSGTIFKSEDESLNMSIFRWLPKLGEDFNLEDSYLDTKEVIEKEPTGKITYTYFANNLFTISYQLEGRLNHIKVIYDRINQQTVTLLISYENKHTASMQPIINNILDSFKVESPVYTQKTSTVPNDNLSNEKKAIYMQSSENIQYETYNNPRFNFSVDYPTKYFEFLPDSANGDGKSMISEDSGVYLSFSAVYNVLDTTIEEEYQKELESIDTVEYKNLGNKSYSLSYYGEHGEIVFVKKTYDEIDNKYITLYFEYDEKYKNFMTPIINKMTNSVKTNTKN